MSTLRELAARALEQMDGVWAGGIHYGNVLQFEEVRRDLRAALAAEQPPDMKRVALPCGACEGKGWFPDGNQCRVCKGSGHHGYKAVTDQPVARRWLAVSAGGDTVRLLPVGDDSVGPDIFVRLADLQAAAPAEQPPTAWMYEHDGCVDRPIVTTQRWKQCEEPWTETPLFSNPSLARKAKS